MPIAVSGSNIVFADGSSIASGFTGFKNRIINGAMVIDQRNNGSSVTVTAGSSAIYPVDRTFANRTNGYTNNATAQRVADAPTGFNYSFKYTVGTAETPTGSMYSNIQHFIEGLNMADLGWGSAGAKTVTLSFWVKLSITGTFGFNLRSGNAGWSYASTFTYSSANTWQFVNVTIPGPTSDGTTAFPIDNSIGVGIFWDLGVGTNLTTSTLNSWQAVNILGTTGTTKINATSGATYQITGVQLEAGSSATSFEYRDYGNELRMCQRYYESGSANPSCFADTFGNAVWEGFYKVDKRAAGTLTYDDANGNTGKIARWFTGSYSSNVTPSGLSADGTKRFSGNITGLSAGALVKVGFNWYQNSEL